MITVKLNPSLPLRKPDPIEAAYLESIQKMTVMIQRVIEECKKPEEKKA